MGDTKGGVPAGEDSHVVMGQLVAGVLAPSTAPTLPEAPEESTLASVLIRVVEVAKTF